MSMPELARPASSMADNTSPSETLRQGSKGSRLSLREILPPALESASRPETPLHQAGLGIKILPSNGEAEHTMKVFIQEHFTSILHPMADKVSELTKDMKRLSDEMERSMQITDRNSDTLNNHEQKLLFINTSVNRLSDDATQTRETLSDCMDKQVEIDGQMDTNNVRMTRLEGNLEAANDSSNEVRKLAEHVDNRLRSAQLSLSEANIQHLSFDDRLSELRNMHDGLSDRHMQMVTTMQQIKTSDENTRQELKRHKQAYEKLKKEEQRSLSLLDQRMKAMEALFLECNHTVQKHGKTIITLSSDMKTCMNEYQEAFGVAKDKEGDRKQLAEDVTQRQVTHAEKVGTRMSRVEELMAQAHRNQVQIKEDNDKRYRELEDIVKKNVVDAKDNNLGIDGLHKISRGLEERVMRSESRISLGESTADALRKNSDKLEAETRSLQSSLRDTSDQVEFQKHELGKTNLLLATTRQDLEDTNLNLSEMGKVCTEIQGAMTKIGNRLELAHDYVSGLSKGLQDTHKRVSSGLDGMIPPRTMAREKKLPEIPGSRPQSQGAASPAPY
jgi:chromosome segregation ATPase